VSRGPWPPKLTDLNRALDVAAKRPDQVARVEITKDGIALILTGAADQPASSTDEDWDKALANDR